MHRAVQRNKSFLLSLEVASFPTDHLETQLLKVLSFYMEFAFYSARKRQFFELSIVRSMPLQHLQIYMCVFSIKMSKMAGPFLCFVEFCTGTILNVLAIGQTQKNRKLCL